MTEPPNPGVVKPAARKSSIPHEDSRPFWYRLLMSTRPMVAVEKDKKTGKTIETLGIKFSVKF